MLAAASHASGSWGAPSPTQGDEQAQDLESLAQRLRALEKALAPPVPSSQQSDPSAGDQSPSEDATEDIVSSMSPSRRATDSSRHGQQASSQHTPGSLSRRVKNIESRLWAAAKERKPTEEFLLKCKRRGLIYVSGIICWSMQPA